MSEATHSERQRNRLAAFGRIHDSHRHLLAFGQMRNAGRAQDRDMDEDVFAAVLAGDETKPLGVVKPLHLSDDRNCSRRIRGHAAWPKPVARWSLGPLDNASSVHLKHPGHLGSLGARADLDAQFGARRNSVVACGVQGVSVQKRVARAARQLDESIPLVRLEPFDDRIDRRGARIDRRGAAPHGCAAETPCVRTAAKASTRTRPRLVRHWPVIVEPALARRPKVLTLAHVSPKSSPKSPIHESATRLLAVRRISAKLRRDISVITIFVGWMRHPNAVDPLNGKIPQSPNGSRDVVWRARAPRSADIPSPAA